MWLIKYVVQVAHMAVSILYGVPERPPRAKVITRPNYVTSELKVCICMEYRWNTYGWQAEIIVNNNEICAISMSTMAVSQCMICITE